MSDQDANVYPGFLRRPMARWNEDGSCAPSSRMRGQQKNEGFVLTLTRDEINEDLSYIEQRAKEVWIHTLSVLLLAVLCGCSITVQQM